MNRDQFWLTDRQFSRIEPHLPTHTRAVTRYPSKTCGAACDRSSFSFWLVPGAKPMSRMGHSSMLVYGAIMINVGDDD